MRWLFFAFVILITLQANGQNYFYSFEGTGASATVSTVKVKNLTTGATLTLYGNEILHLTGKGEIPWSGSEQNVIIIYPNPVTKDNAVLQIHPPYSGRAVIRICDLTGKIAAQAQVYLGNYVQQFRLSGVSKGFNIINVIGNGYHYSATLLWNGTADGPVSLVKISDNNPADENIPENNYGGIQDTILMFYSIGDRLMFKGISENFSTIIMDIPSGDKKITFPFFSCSDADNNNYTVVEIGSQIWMAENLMTTRYNDGTAIAYPGINDYDWNNNTRGAYAWYDNNEASNKDIYGALYNWKAINTGILCPSDWHVPTDHEWITLSDYLGGTNVAGGKIKDTGTSYWYSPDNKSTNESGFSALPGGMRNLTGFSDIKVGGHWWSSTFYRNLLRPSGWHLSSVSEILDKNITVSANEGLSVRCIIGQSAVSIPFVLTDEIKDISTNSATVSGMVISDEGATITNFGICWDISKNPTVENQKNSGATVKDNFIANVTGLKPGTIYHVRAYATNSAGTAYGDDLYFTTLTELPVLTTSTVTNIAQNAAESGGNITYDGGGTITGRGICWATTASPTISDARTANGTGTGSFTSGITGLQPGTTYYIRAYATNSAGTAYGDDLSFTTQVALPVLTTSTVTNIAQTAAESGGNITYDGSGVVTARGVCWATSSAPTISDTRTANGTGTGSFTSGITGLQPGTTYHIRAYATNSAGTAYGDDLSFTTQVALPILTTSTVTNIAQTAAESGGNISYDGGGTVTARGVCWATSSAPIISDTRTANGTGTGSFTSSITGLQPGATYHVRAYATNSAGTAYGEDLSFATQVALPVLTTSPVTNIAQTTAASGGNITYDGGGSITVRGVCWATIAYPTISDARTANGTGTGSFTSSITGLLPGTTYHVRAYATNSAGTAYGDDLSFTTLIALPVLTTSPATNIRQTTASSGGNITYDGGGTITERGVCWATTFNPTISNNKIIDGSGTGTFTSSITGLQPGTIYHVRAYATNSAGTAYGDDLSFMTLTELPVLTTSAVTIITQTSAASGGNITDDGGRTITERGICWATIAYPTITDARTTNGTGTGSFTSSIIGLQPGTTYHVRAYATNSAGTAYGNDLAFTTAAYLPSLTTMPVTNVAQTTAASGGNITDDGGGSITERGVCWATTASPTISDIRTANGTGTGSFTSSITGLRPGTTFYLRAFATNSAGTAYGNEFSFTTQVALPSLTTFTSTNITQTTAVSGGNITDDGGGLITERGVCWATISNPTISNSKTTDGSGTGSFISTLTGLQPGTDYHVRSYATNSAGTAYGNQVNFSTIPEAPPEVDFYVPGEAKLLHSVGDKKIIFQIVGADAYIKFSNDNGVSYNAGVRVTGIFTEDNKARILGNGNIVLFCGNKIYYSDDNMETINPGIVLNKDGSTYSCHEPVNPAYPGAYFNFMGGFIENAGVCLLGNYSNTSMGASPVNLYYSLDGITWKVIYTFGQDLHYTDNGTAMGGYGGTLLGDPANPLMARHFHSVNIGDDGNFYACTGDGDREIHILKCSYDRGADSWIINDLLSAESMNWQRMRSLGFFERNGYFYWGSDGPGTFTFKGVVYNCFGIYKCPVTDINDPSKHILLQSLSDACYSFLNVGHTVVAGLQSYGYVYISFDYGETWLAYQKPSWMTGSVEGLWFNESQKYFVTRSGVVISSVSF
jgi:uncharacterized protein (TIGR02145 family)